MSRTPTQAEVILAAVRSGLAEVHTAIPAEVRRYDAAKRLCDAAPLIRSSYTDETGAIVVEALPVVPNVPIVFPGGGGFSLTFPIEVGDVVLLVFSEASLDKWLSQGGTVDPLDERRHALADAIAIPGLRPFAGKKAATPANAEAPGLAREESGIGVFVTTGDEVRLGLANASKALALAEATDARLDALRSAFSGHTHPIAAVPTTCGAGPGTATGSTSAGPVVAPLASVASARVKADS